MVEMNIEKITKIEDLLKCLKSLKNDYYLFGAGVIGQIWGQFLNKYGIKWAGYIDNNPKLHDKQICGKNVYFLSDIPDKSSISISISISPGAYLLKYKDICRQLQSEGVTKNQIINIAKNSWLANQIALDVKDAKKYFSRVSSLKNVFEGKRAFVIGNGPSLRIADLTQIKDEISFGCNTLFDLFDKTPFRPTVYFFEDPEFIKRYFSKNDEVLYRLTSECKYVISSFRNRIFDEYKEKINNLYFINSYINMNDTQFSSDISQIVYVGGTSLFLIMQFALYMGIKEIYLLGVDFSFRNEASKNGKVTVNENIQNHQSNMEQFNSGVYYTDVILEAWNCAKKYADTHGVKIYNATRGGKLEVFPRVDFDSLFLD